MFRRVAVPAIALFAASCTITEAPKAPARLDERLRPGQTRAGLVTRESELLGGPTAKGRVGDYKIYNSRIAVIIADPGVARGFQPYGGVILDADRVRPEGEEGKTTFGEVISGLDLAVIHPKRAEIINDGSDGKPARIRFFGEEDVMPLFDSFFSALFSPSKHAMTWDIDYVLEPDADWLRIEHTMKNIGRETIEIGLPIAAFMFGDGARPFMPEYGFQPARSSGFGAYYGAIAEDVSYLYGRHDASVAVIVSESGIVVSGLGEGFKLRAIESETVVHHLVVGDGDLARTQAMWRRSASLPQLPLVEGRVTEDGGRGVPGARVHVALAEPRDEERDYVTQAKTDRDGRYTLAVPPGAYRVTVAADGHRVSASRELSIIEGESKTGVDFAIPREGRIAYDVTDDQGRALPVKISVRALGESAAQLPGRYGEVTQGSGLLSTVFAIAGRGTIGVPAGDYRLWISRGTEYEIAERDVTVRAGADTSLVARLARTVETPGWLSTDTHIHSQLSPDSPDLFPMKVSAMVTEGLEIPVSTEHEAIGDFNPAIVKLGLEDWIQGIIGTEVTTYIYGHFNAFPMVPDPTKPGNGRIEWYHKPPAETFALIRQNPGDPFIQVNHPRAPAIGGYLSAMGFDAAAFSFQRADDASLDFDALEVANGCDVDEMERSTMIDWFAFLNHSHRVYATGATDNHRAAGGDMGYPRTYVRMPTDEPRAATVDDVRASFKAGRLIVSCGPFVEMKIGDAEIGDTAVVTGDALAIDARVAAPTWMDVDRIEVIVNGELVKTVDVPETSAADRFAGTIDVPITAGRDGWVVLRVRGDRGHGVWARHRPSYAFTNAIYLDGNDDGAWVMP